MTDSRSRKMKRIITSSAAQTKDEVILMEQFITKFTSLYESLIRAIAEIVAHTLELIGIIIVIIGSIKALALVFKSLKAKCSSNVVINLGRSLALALEFKMGAEIINTVVFREFKELAILGLVIIIRALLAFIIHWEIKAEQKNKV